MSSFKSTTVSPASTVVDAAARSFLICSYPAETIPAGTFNILATSSTVTVPSSRASYTLLASSAEKPPSDETPSNACSAADASAESEDESALEDKSVSSGTNVGNKVPIPAPVLGSKFGISKPVSGSYHFPAGRLSQAALILSVKPAVPPICDTAPPIILSKMPVVTSRSKAKFCPGK